MKHRMTALAVAVSTGCLTACASLNNSADLPSFASGGPSTGTLSAPISSSVKVAKLGEAVEVHGLSDGSALTVTAVALVPITRTHDEWDAHGPLVRYVQVHFKITNTGTVTYRDSPNLGARLIDSEGGMHRLASWSPLTGTGPVTPFTLAPSESTEGLVVFEVPRDTKISRVRVSMDEAADFKQFETDPVPLPAEWDLRVASVNP